MYTFEKPVYVRSYASVAGKKESEGPLGGKFDIEGEDNEFGQPTWEKSESHMISLAYEQALSKAGLTPAAIEALLGGDLLNQCISTSFAAKRLGPPFFGLYGACSTMSESLILGACLISGGFGKNVLCSAASHFCSAERQYRFPLEYGGQRTPDAQWTATAAGAVVLSAAPSRIRVTKAQPGRIHDPGAYDVNNMGAAMALGAYETLTAFFQNSGQTPADFDLIVTGDLAAVGKGIVIDLFERDGVDIRANYDDCGLMLFSEDQDVAAGASGCGCSAAVLCAHILPSLESGALGRVLFCGTGALLSPLSIQQNDSIPGICHLVCLEAC